MPFIIVFNIIIAVMVGIDLLTILTLAVISRDNKKRVDEKSRVKQQKIDKNRNICYIVFFAILILSVIINLIF